MTSGQLSNHPLVTNLRPALMLIALVLVVKVVYIVWGCPYNLVEDEAHYWLWSRHLDWSYYSKGPGIAWVIWMSTRVFGHAEWAVRMPTVIAQGVGALACAGLARDVARAALTGDGRAASPSRAGLYAAAAFLLAPAFQLTGVLVTIDGCYLACWALACWLGWRAIFLGTRGAWVGLGLVLGVGFLFKYTILLLVPGLVVFALMTRARVRVGWMVLGLLIFVGTCAPVVYWNAREGWPTIRHLLGHLGVQGGDMPVSPSDAGATWMQHIKWPLGYVGAPFGMFGPLLVLAIVAARRRLRRRGSESDSPPARRAGVLFLLCCSAPILIFYLGVSFIAEPEQNWAIGGMVSLMVLVGWFVADELARQRAGVRATGEARTRPIQVIWRVGIIYGVCAAMILHRADVGATILNRVAQVPPVAGAFKAVMGRAANPIVTGRLIGTREMGAHVNEILTELGAGTREGAANVAVPPPLVICEHYGRASQMAYELFRLGRTTTPVLSSQSIMGGRRSQFDFWADTRLDRSDLRGASALLMSNDQPQKMDVWKSLFEQVVPLDSPEQKLRGEHKRDRIAYIGYGYRGPARADETRRK